MEVEDAAWLSIFMLQRALHLIGLFAVGEHCHRQNGIVFTCWPYRTPYDYHSSVCAQPTHSFLPLPCCAVPPEVNPSKALYEHT